MGLDYTNRCVNFRDVGEFVNLIAEKTLMKEKKLYRGGKIDYIQTIHDINNPATIINLRKGPDTNTFNKQYFHFPISNDYEKYDTSVKEVRIWLNNIFRIFENKNLEYPVFFHCTSGKDRTGVVIAVLLMIINIPENIIIQEYLLSEGEVNKEWITTALNGLNKIISYFDRLDFNSMKHNLVSGLMDNS